MTHSISAFFILFLLFFHSFHHHPLALESTWFWAPWSTRRSWHCEEWSNLPSHTWKIDSIPKIVVLQFFQQKNLVKNRGKSRYRDFSTCLSKSKYGEKKFKKNREFIQSKYLYLHDTLVLLGGSTFHFHESLGKIMGAWQVSRISSCIIPDFPSLTSTAKYILPFETIKWVWRDKQWPSWIKSTTLLGT